MSNKKGFTLVELLVTIGIIGILATVTVVSVGGARAKARDSKRLADVKQIQSALELVGNDLGGFYPGGTGVTLGDDGATNATYDVICDNGVQKDTTGCTTTYLNPIPKDPTNTGTSIYKYTATKAGGACAAGAKDCDAYTVSFILEGKTGSLEKGAHTATNTGIK